MNSHVANYSKTLFYALLLLIGLVASVPLVPQLAKAQTGPAMQAEGAKIAFLSDRDRTPGLADIYLMNPDGSNLTRLTVGLDLRSISSHSLSGLEDRLAWSPLDQKFLYSTPAGELYSVTPGGSEVTLVTDKVYQFALSPDNQYIASYVLEPPASGDIVITNMAGADRTVLTNQATRQTLDLQANSPILGTAWSPDGSKIAFYAAGSLFMMNADGSEPIRLTPAMDIVAFNFEWSPDGRYIAFFTFDGPTLQLLDVQSGRISRLAENAFGPAWSPDGSKIAFTRGDGQIWLMNVNGTGLAQLTTTGRNCCPIWVSDPALSQVEAASEPVTVISADTPAQSSRTAAEPPWRLGTPISMDGRYIVFSSQATNLVAEDTNDVEDVFIYDRETNQINRVSVASDGTQGNGRSASPAISADGRYIAFASEADNLVDDDTNGARDIFIHDRETSQISRVSVASDGAQGNGRSDSPAISADGRYISFSSEANNLVGDDANDTWDIFVYDQETGETSRVQVSETFSFPVEVSAAEPDLAGQATEAATEPTPVFIPTPAPTPVFIPTPVPPPTPAAEIYRLVYSKWDGGRHNLYIGDTAGSTEQFVLHNGAGPSWSLDGQYIFFYGEPSVNIQRRNSPGQATCEFPKVSDGLMAVAVPPAALDVCQAQADILQELDWKVGTARGASVSPDGKMVIYDARISGNYRIYFLDINGGDQSRFEISGEQGDWSPDSQKIVYRSSRDGQTGLWLANRNDSGHVMITANGSDSFPIWSPDGQTLAFSRETGGNVDIYTMNVDGSNLKRLTTAFGPDALPAYTPAGEIIFRSARTGSWGIWKMNGDGSNQQEIIPNAGVGPDWAYSKMDVLP
jgi:Tol biopolymer transport system component